MLNRRRSKPASVSSSGTNGPLRRCACTASAERPVRIGASRFDEPDDEEFDAEMGGEGFCGCCSCAVEW